MLTKEKEAGRNRCFQYWPEEGAIQYSSLQVIAHGQSSYSDYILREITLVDTNVWKDKFELIHLHLLTGMSSSSLFLDLLHTITTILRAIMNSYSPNNK